MFTAVQISNFRRYMIREDYGLAMAVIGIRWNVIDFNQPEDVILKNADDAFLQSIKDFFEQNKELFNELEDYREQGFITFMQRSLNANPVRAAIIDVLMRKQLMSPSKITVDLTDMTEQEVNQYKLKLSEMLRSDNNTVIPINSDKLGYTVTS